MKTIKETNNIGSEVQNSTISMFPNELENTVENHQDKTLESLYEKIKEKYDINFDFDAFKEYDEDEQIYIFDNKQKFLEWYFDNFTRAHMEQLLTITNNFNNIIDIDKTIKDLFCIEGKYIYLS